MRNCQYRKPERSQSGSLCNKMCWLNKRLNKNFRCLLFVQWKIKNEWSVFENYNKYRNSPEAITNATFNFRKKNNNFQNLSPKFLAHAMRLTTNVIRATEKILKDWNYGLSNINMALFTTVMKMKVCEMLILNIR